MLGGKGLAAGCASLEQHRRALRRGFAQVIARHLEVFALADFMHFFRVGENAAFAVAHYRTSSQLPSSSL
jgi:hypothetical protein